jgi:hypothetical protein
MEALAAFPSLAACAITSLIGRPELGRRLASPSGSMSRVVEDNERLRDTSVLLIHPRHRVVRASL